jgi:hypothetical protein
MLAKLILAILMQVVTSYTFAAQEKSIPQPSAPSPYFPDARTMNTRSVVTLADGSVMSFEFEGRRE